MIKSLRTTSSSLLGDGYVTCGILLNLRIAAAEVFVNTILRNGLDGLYVAQKSGITTHLAAVCFKVDLGQWDMSPTRC